jgi:hypothetical protein
MAMCDCDKTMRFAAAPAAPQPPVEDLRALDIETVQTLLDLLNPLHGSLDEQTYDEKYKDEFNAPPDKEYSINITAKQERDLNQAVILLERRLKEAAHSALESLPDGATLALELREALEEIAERCEKASHVAAPICLTEAHVDHLRQIASYARSALASQSLTAGPKFGPTNWSDEVTAAVIEGGRDPAPATLIEQSGQKRRERG